MTTEIKQGDLDWADLAECSGLTELFFGDPGEKPQTRKVREDKAVAICKTCPVMYQCRQFARENRELGVWGGETEDERYFGGFLKDPDVVRRHKERAKRARIAGNKTLVE